VIAPTVAAIWFGFRARRHGRPGGLVPVVVGIVVAVGAVLTRIRE
jgi:hypothetical protein